MNNTKEENEQLKEEIKRIAEMRVWSVDDKRVKRQIRKIIKIKRKCVVSKGDSK